MIRLTSRGATALFVAIALLAAACGSSQDATDTANESGVEGTAEAVSSAFELAAELPHNVALLPDGRPAPLVYDNKPEQERFYLREANGFGPCDDECVSSYTVYDADMVARGSFELDGRFSAIPLLIPNLAFLYPWDESGTSYLVDLQTGTINEWPYARSDVLPDPGYSSSPKGRLALTNEPTADSPWIVVTDESAIAVVDLRTNEKRSLADGARLPQFSPSGRWLSYLDRDDVFTVLDLASGQIVATIASVEGLAVGELDEVSWSPGESRVAYSGSIDGVLTVQVADLIAGSMMLIEPMPEFIEPSISGWHDDAQLLVLGRRAKAQLLNVVTGEWGPIIDSDWDNQLSATQQWHVTSDSGGTLVLTDIESGETVATTLPDMSLEPLAGMRTPRFEWRAADDVPGSIRIDLQSGEVTSYELFRPMVLGWPVAVVPNETFTGVFITSPEREPVFVEAVNSGGFCANGDVVSSGMRDQYRGEFPGRVHSYETGELLYEFEPERITCFG